MDAFLEDGSHEATTAVVRALVVAVPHTTEKLRDYILNVLYIFFFKVVEPHVGNPLDPLGSSQPLGEDNR